MKHQNHERKLSTRKSIQQNLFRTQLILIITLALFLGIAGILTNIHFERQKRDQNLQNVAEAIAYSPILIEASRTPEQYDILREYLDSLKNSLDDIDVISVVHHDNIRLYHSNHDLIGTTYHGTIPQFSQHTGDYYATNDNGPSGTQRRAYAAIYDENGNYLGFVIAVMLMENIRGEMLQTLWIFSLITFAAILMELVISTKLSGKIRDSLLGYEPDVFSAMYQIRENILESLDEGIIAIDGDSTVQFANRAALDMLKTTDQEIVGQKLDTIPDGTRLKHILEGTDKKCHIQTQVLDNTDVLIDRIPIKEEHHTTVQGSVGILHNRAEYTKLMEDLAGTRYLVDSMRANNHDFTNKLHVILGLIQMEMYDEATSYIENITIVQRATISSIMKAVSDPAVAALLIGKTARASELNVKFILREGCAYANTDLPLPSETLITIIGNLIDNAFDAMNEPHDSVQDHPNELLFGIYSHPGAVLITVDDTGTGISDADLEHIFENGYSTKGEGRGTGLYQVKALVEGLGGIITVESQLGVGTSFSVSFTKK